MKKNEKQLVELYKICVEHIDGLYKINICDNLSNRDELYLNEIKKEYINKIEGMTFEGFYGGLIEMLHHHILGLKD